MPAAVPVVSGRLLGRMAVKTAEEAGRLILKTGWPRGTAHRGLGRHHAAVRRPRSIAGPGTAGSPHRRCSNRWRRRWPRFTAAHFGRDGTLDDGALDEALADRQPGAADARSSIKSGS